jgi:hypothetical protein
MYVGRCLDHPQSFCVKLSILGTRDPSNVAHTASNTLATSKVADGRRWPPVDGGGHQQMLIVNDPHHESVIAPYPPIANSSNVDFQWNSLEVSSRVGSSVNKLFILSFL